MLEKGDVKVVGNAHNKQFRRRFSVPFSMFKDIVEEARDWIELNGKKLGDRVTDCVGVLGVPLELKILGALRMSAKGCSFDAIAELNGMSISTMQTFYHQFWAKFVSVFHDRWIVYPTTAHFTRRSPWTTKRMKMLKCCTWLQCLFSPNQILLHP